MSDPFSQARDLFRSGIADFEAGRFADAESRFRASLALLPDRVSTLTNLAASLIRQRRQREALEVLDRALALAPADQEAWWQRAVALGALADPLGVLQALDRLLALAPDHGPGWVRQGQTLQQLERLQDAEAAYRKALQIDAHDALAWGSLGSVLKDLGRLPEAAMAFERALDNGGDTAVNRYFLAAVTGLQAPALAPVAYVQNLFDAYAASFDTHLLEVLQYRAHTVLVEGLRSLCAGRTFRRALDLGCGTGLCGPLLQPCTGHVDGVDLSAAMLEQARALGVYAELAQADVAQYLRATPQRYDLVVATDVFIYIGDLEPVFAGVARVLDAEGWFCFSIENAAPGQDVELKPSLRYGQSEAYVRGLARRHGFEVEQVIPGAIREEQRQAIAGAYVYLRRR